MTEEERLNELGGALTTETIEVNIEPSAEPSECSENSELSESSEDSVKSESSEDSEDESSETSKSNEEIELEEMISRIGAAGILEIIRGNRNMIIEELIAEAKSRQRRGPMPSGISSSKEANSIFDIAAFA